MNDHRTLPQPGSDDWLQRYWRYGSYKRSDGDSLG